MVKDWDHGDAVIVEHQLPTVQQWGTDKVYSVYLPMLFSHNGRAR